MTDYFDLASLLIGALGGACVALLALLRFTRRCNCLSDAEWRERD